MTGHGGGWVPGTAEAEARFERILDESRRADLAGADAALADVLLAIRAPATDDELSGLDAAMAAFVARSEAPTPRAWARLARRLAAVPVATLLASGGLVAVGGMAAAAYTGTLPAGLQDLAHRAIGAPAPEAEPAPVDPPDE